MLPSEITELWVPGWAASRGTPRPVPTEWGYRIDVGAPDQVLRHVLLNPEEAGVRELAAGISTPATWLKAAVEPGPFGAWLPAGWTEGSPGWLMAADVRPAAVAVPDGYTVTAERQGDVTHVRILAADGSPAARGQLGHAGTSGTVDQIATESAHQRRGLGTVVMGTLANAAYAAGESVSVLGATVEGRALYEALGWKVHAPLASFVYEG